MNLTGQQITLLSKLYNKPSVSSLLASDQFIIVREFSIYAANRLLLAKWTGSKVNAHIFASALNEYALEHVHGWQPFIPTVPNRAIDAKYLAKWSNLPRNMRESVKIHISYRHIGLLALQVESDSFRNVIRRCLNTLSVPGWIPEPEQRSTGGAISQWTGIITPELYSRWRNGEKVKDLHAELIAAVRVVSSSNKE